MLSEYLKHYAKAILVPEKNCNNKYPTIKVLDIFSDSFKMMCNNLKYALLTISCFAFTLTIISFVFNNSIICSLPIAGLQKTFKCAPGVSVISAAYFLLKIFIISMFIRVWYNSVTSRKNIKISEFCLPRFVDIKIFFALIIFLSINILPVVSFWTLQAREPNPNWIIESLFFAFVSLGFIIPLITIAYYVLIAFVAKEQKFPSFGTINGTIFANITKIFFSTVIIMFLATYMVANCITTMLPYFSYNIYTATICAELIYNAITLVLIAFFENYIINLQQSLFDNHLQ